MGESTKKLVAWSAVKCSDALFILVVKSPRFKVVMTWVFSRVCFDVVAACCCGCYVLINKVKPTRTFRMNTNVQGGSDVLMPRKSRDIPPNLCSPTGFVFDYF